MAGVDTRRKSIEARKPISARSSGASPDGRGPDRPRTAERYWAKGWTLSHAAIAA